MPARKKTKPTPVAESNPPASTVSTEETQPLDSPVASTLPQSPTEEAQAAISSPATETATPESTATELPPEEIQPSSPQAEPVTSTSTTAELSSGKTAEAASEAVETESSPPEFHPIPAPTERLQYRAIGLIPGRYLPSADEFNQGILLARDGTVIDAALLGRLVTLVKKHLDLSAEHLWVVYPRTPGIKKPVESTDGEEAAEETTEQAAEVESTTPQPKLHVQMVGVWAPDQLHPDQAQTPPSNPVESDVFSIRGEVVFFHKEEEWMIVKIIQKPKQQGDKPFIIKLKLFGRLTDPKPMKKFWDLQVKRQGDQLVIESGQFVANFGKPKGKKPGQGKFVKGKKPYRKPEAGTVPPSSGSDKPKPKPIPRPKQG